ncbi:hypothetical protein FIA58_010120 [Flavobacterium jejuense]|uniref:Uncharacterized protein n=1 Tax=Flavobacterium jejuense TaxID=1544455 RepID=A0ABX0IQE0_9FLAO|nr:hypothetical protein [Flavobacterium jejuense]NHN26030.1 hypothetical protein [Flavobacterium jejuense]
MENQKDIEILKSSLALKLELFNKIRYGYDTVKEEFNFKDVNKASEDYPVINDEKEVVDDLEKELVLVDENVEELKVESRNSSERKSAMNISNLGTSYFGRRRR